MAVGLAAQEPDEYPGLVRMWIGPAGSTRLRQVLPKVYTAGCGLFPMASLLLRGGGRTPSQ